MALIPIRKPRPFAGARGKSLKDLYSAVIGSKGIVQLNVLKNSTNKRYNTEVFVLVKEATATKLAEYQTALYNRITIAEVFRLAGFQTVEGDYKATAFTVAVDHPLPNEEVIRIFNGKHACDFDENDIKITHISGSLYTVEALPKSLGYIGKAEINIGEKIYVPLVPTEHALFASETSAIVESNVIINDSQINLLNKEQFKTTGVIFKEFNLPSGKLSYILNTNDVSLNVVIGDDKTYTPTDNNLNETVQETRNTFVLSPFVEATVERVGDLQLVPNRTRMTTWLNSYAELDAIFKVQVDGQTQTITDLISSESIEVLKVGDVLEVTNLTYQPLNIKLSAKTISLPALEDPSLRFLNFANQQALVDGYEVYNLQLEAAEVPLTKITIQHHKPVSIVYNQLLAKHNLAIGLPPVVKRDMFDRIVSISSLNHSVDGYTIFDNIVEVSGTSKVIDADIYANGLKFLDVFSIPAADWTKLVDPTNLNGKVITITRTADLANPITAQYSFNDLQSIGIVDPVTQDFVFAFVGYGNYNGKTTFAYPEVAKRHLAGTIELTTSYNLVSAIEPTLFFSNDPTLPERVKVRFSTIPELGYTLASIEPFTVEVSPTEDDLKLGKVDYGFNYALAFDKTITPLLDYAISHADANLTHNIVSFKSITAIAAKFNLSPLGITVGDYKTNGFTGLEYNETTNRYHYNGRVSGYVPVSNLAYVDGVASVQVTSNTMQLIYDPDSSVGGTFREVNTNVIIPAVYEVKLTVLEAPTFSYPQDMEEVTKRALVELGVTDTLNETGSNRILSLTDNNFEVNLIDTNEEKTYHYVLECNVSQERLTKLVADYNPLVKGVFDGVNLERSLSSFINYYQDGRCFHLTGINRSGETIIELDVDGDKPHYNKVTTTLSQNVNIIPAPQNPTVVLDLEANAESQNTLLAQLVSPGDDTIQVDPVSPFDIYKAPLNPISQLFFDNLEGITVLDGVVNDIDEKGLIGVEFKMFLEPTDVNNFLNPLDVVARISKSGTEWSLDLNRNMFKQQTYIKDGEVHFFALFKINPDVDYNGVYEFDIDWDGLGTDDSYILDEVNRNHYYRQKIQFQLDLEAIYLPVDLESVRVFWVSNQKAINAAILDPLDTTYPKDYDVTEAVPLRDIEIVQNDNLVETTVYQETLDPTKKFTLYIETEITDEIFVEWLSKASITVSTDGNEPVSIHPSEFNTLLHRDNAGKYFLRRVCTAENATQSLVYTIDLDADGKRFKKTTSTLHNRTIVIEASVSPGFDLTTDQLLINAVNFPGLEVTPNPTLLANTTVTQISDTEIEVEVIDQIDATPKQFTVFAKFQGDVTQLNPEGTIQINDEPLLPANYVKDLNVVFNGASHLPLTIEPNNVKEITLKTDVDAENVRWKKSTSNIKVTYKWVARQYSPGVTWASIDRQNAILDARAGIPAIDEVFTNRNNIDITLGGVVGFDDKGLVIESFDDALGKYTIAFFEINNSDEKAITELLANGKITADLGAGIVDLDTVYGINYTRPFEFEGQTYLGVVLPYSNTTLTARLTTQSEEVNKYYVPKLSELALAIKMTTIMESPNVIFPTNQEELLAVYNDPNSTPDLLEVTVNSDTSITVKQIDLDPERETRATIFVEFVGSAAALAKLNQDSIINVTTMDMTFTLDDMINFGAMSNVFVHEGRYYAAMILRAGNINKGSMVNTFGVDVDAGNKAYRFTSSTLTVTTDVAIRDPNMEDISCAGSLDYTLDITTDDSLIVSINGVEHDLTPMTPEEIRQFMQDNGVDTVLFPDNA